MIIANDVASCHRSFSSFPLQNIFPLASFIPNLVNEKLFLLYRYGTGSKNSTSLPYPDDATPLINRLPIELLAEIFFRTLEDPAPYTQHFYRPIYPKLSFSPGKYADPMLLAQVCGHWRSIALSTPLLWSSINVHYSSERRSRIELLDTWLERSGQCPLSITLCEHDVDECRPNVLDDLRTLQGQIASRLISHAYRWKAIEFRFEHELPPVLGELCPRSLPILESAIVEDRNPNYHGAYWEEEYLVLDRFWSAIHASPRFRNAHWDIEYSCHQYRHQRFRDVQWTNLTTMNVTMPTDLLLEILPHCKNLVDLHFTDHYWTYPLTVSTLSLPEVFCVENPIILPRLRNIYLTTTVSTDTFLKNTTAPSLISFSLCQSQRHDMVNPKPSTFERFLMRSNCRLQAYSYKYAVLGAGGEDLLLEILDLPSMSFLVELTVYASYDMPKLIPFLTRTSENLNRLPNLARISISREDPFPGAYENMLMSRNLPMN